MKAQVILIIALLGLVASQRISVPLKATKDQKFYISIKQGSSECEVNVIPSIDFCSNIITETNQQKSQCGSTFISDDSFYYGESDYSAQFQIGNSETNFEFTIPSEQSRYKGQNLLCFGVKGFDNQRNALIELFNAGKISQQRVFFSLNELSNTQSENSIAGQMDIGQPDLSLIKQGSQLVQLKGNSGESYYTAYSNRDVKFNGKALDSRNVVFIDLSSPYSALTYSAFDSILNIIKGHGIDYTFVGQGENSQVLLNSIQTLKDLEFTLQTVDNTPFVIRLQPTQYTRPTEDGRFELLIKPLSYTGSITIGNIAFESYYIGFDLPTYSIHIAEKGGKQQLYNFRGASQQE